MFRRLQQRMQWIRMGSNTQQPRCRLQRRQHGLKTDGRCRTCPALPRIRTWRNGRACMLNLNRWLTQCKRHERPKTSSNDLELRDLSRPRRERISTCLPCFTNPAIITKRRTRVRCRDLLLFICLSRWSMAFLAQSGVRAFGYICRRHSPSVYSIIWEGWFTGTASGLLWFGERVPSCFCVGGRAHNDVYILPISFRE